MPLSKQHLIPIKFIIPLFLFNQMLAAFLRNDNNPGLATIAVLAGGIFNVFGDYFFGMDTTIMRRYGLSFVFLPFNIFSIYYFISNL